MNDHFYGLTQPKNHFTRSKGGFAHCSFFLKNFGNTFTHNKTLELIPKTRKMKPYIKRNMKKLMTYLTLIFILLFFFRLFYGYQTVDETTPPQVFIDHLQSESGINIRKNYATKKYKVGTSPSPIGLDQKYEKIADIKTYTTKFDIEEASIRNEVKDYDGLIQFENKSGNKGYRRLNLIIGVPPQHFDSIYQNLIKIGKVQAKQITKTDKTNEYKELNAKKASLEKIRQSLINLKEKGGKIEEYMQLENRILEIEQQLQALGVSLGNFDDENEFCTVKVVLSEGKKLSIGLLQRVKVALEWTIKYYALSMIALTFAALFSYLLLLFIKKIKLNK